jgi:NADH:ubiquinone oxidoreductase subunit K
MTPYVLSLFVIGSYGMLFPKNIMGFLMSIEILVLASTTHILERVVSQNAQIESVILILFFLVIAGAELSLGLSLLMRAFKQKRHTALESFHDLKG